MTDQELNKEEATLDTEETTEEETIEEQQVVEEETEEPKPSTSAPKTLEEIAKIVRESHEARKKLLENVKRSIRTGTGKKQAVGKLTVICSALNDVALNLSFEIIRLAQQFGQMRAGFQVAGQVAEFRGIVIAQSLLKKGLLTEAEMAATAQAIEQQMQNAKLQELSKQQEEQGIPKCRTCDACDEFQRCQLMDGQRVDDYYASGTGSPDACPLRPMSEEEVKEIVAEASQELLEESRIKEEDAADTEAPPTDTP